MSRTTRGNARRRISLLTTSSFVATSLLSGGAVLTAALTPSIAYANNECGAYAATLNCTTDQNNGITYATGDIGGNLTLNVIDIQVDNTGGTPGPNGITLNSNNAYDLSVVFQSVGGPATNVNGINGSTGNGILINSSGGNVSLDTADDQPNLIQGSTGVRVSTNGAGTANVFLGALDTVKGDTAPGMEVTTTAGANTVTVLGDVSSTDQEALKVLSGSGPINVTVGTTATLHTNNPGVHYDALVSSDDADVTVNTAGVYNNGGLRAESHDGTSSSTGNVTITSTGGSMTSNSNTGGAVKIVTDNGKATLDLTDTAVQANGFADGAQVITQGGDIDIQYRTGNTLSSTLGDAMTADTQTGGINIRTQSDIGSVGTSTGDEGIVATIGSGAATKSIDIDVGGNIYAQSNGIRATNSGSGNINITTQKGFDIVTQTADGIDAFALNGGNVTINLLDGAINANTSHFVPSGPSGSGPGAPAIHASAVLGGTVTINAEDNQTNFGGDGDLTTTVDGTNYVGISASIDNVGGDGVDASSTGSGDVIVSGFGADGFALHNGTNPSTADDGVTGAINTSGGDGINAHASGTGNIFVKTLTGGTIGGDADNGITGAQTGLGNITIDANDDIGTSGNHVGLKGINANIQNVNSTGTILAGSNANVYASDTGIDATTNGLGAVKATYGLTSTSNITLDTTGNIGVNASITNPLSSATATAEVGNANFTTEIKAAKIGVEVANSGTGDAIYISHGNVIVDPDDYGVEANPGVGLASISTGSNDSYTVDDGLDTVSDSNNRGLYAHSAATSGANTKVVLGVNNTIVVEDTFDGEADGGAGIAALNTGNGTGGVTVDSFLGAGNTITVTGDNAVGIQAQTNYAGATGSGDVFVGTNAGAITVNGGDGADATGNFDKSYGILATTNGGDVVVVNDSSITVTNGGGAATTGIFAQTTGAGSIDVTSGTFDPASVITTTNGDGIHAEIIGGGTGSIEVGDTLFGPLHSDITTNVDGDGVEATTDGDGAITVRHASDSTITINGTGRGIYAHNTAGAAKFGDVTVNTDGDIVTNGDGAGNEGVFATTNGNGLVTVIQTANGSVTTKGVQTDGISASNTSGANGDVVIDAAGATDATGNGLIATSNTNDNVFVTTQATATVKAGLDGINATITSANGQDVVVTHGGAITGAGGNGIFVTSLSNGDVGVETKAGSTIDATGGDGIHAYALGGTVVNDSNVIVLGNGTIGAVSTVSGNGIDAQITNAANGGKVQVTQNGSVNANLDGIHAQTAGSGTVTVITGAGNITANTGDGIDASSQGGTVTVTTGTGAVKGDPGILAVVNGGTGDAKVTTGGNVTGTASDGVHAQVIGGSGNVIVKAVGAGLISGADDGIDASTNGSGDVTVTTNAGANVQGAVNGINAASSSGSNVSVTNSGLVTGGTGAGVKGSVVGLGNVTVTVNNNVTGASGVTTTAQTGVNHVSVLTGTVKGTAGDGINDTVTNGTAIVDTKSGTNILATGDGIHIAATAAGGTVSVTARGTIGAGTKVGGDGIDASTVDTSININAYNNITAADRGIRAASGSGAVTVTTDAGTTVSGDTGGIDASTGAAKAVIVNNHGTVLGGTGTGIKATSAGGNTLVAVDGVVTGGVGVDASTTGTGTVTVTDTGFTVTGTTGDGVFAHNTGTGTVSVGQGTGNRFFGNVVGKTNGIEATGGGTVNVFTANDITGQTGLGVSATGATGPITVDTLGGTINGSTGGILAKSTGTGDVAVTNLDDITIATGRGIDAESSGGEVTVDSNATINGGKTGIYASNTTGTIYVGNVNSILGSFTGQSGAGSAGIQTVNGSGYSQVSNQASMTSLANADYGIKADSTTGGIYVYNNNGGIGAAGAGNGVNVAGISAASSGANTNGITVYNYANIWVDNGGTAGISAVNAGTGSIYIQNSGAIDPAAYGIFASGGGNVQTDDYASVIGNIGIHSDTSGAASTSTINVYNNAPITGLTGNAIENFGTAGGNVTVNTVQSGLISGATNGIATKVTGGTGATNITTGNSITAAAGRGIDAQSTGTGVINVTSSGGTITATTDGIFASGNSTITVSNSDTITGVSNAGISTVNTTGTTNVTNSGSMSSLAGATFGIKSTATSGAINITDSGQINAKTGIHADNTGNGAITVLVTGGNGVTGVAGNGIEASTTGNGTVSVGTSGSRINAPVSGTLNGIRATGLGDVQVWTNNVAVSGGNAALSNWGINATSTPGGSSAGGAVTVNTLGTVSGAQGIQATTNGTDASDTVSVTTANTVSGSLGVGIKAAGVNGAVGVTSSALVTGATDGINASSSGAGTVTVNASVQGTAVTGGNNGIVATSTGGANVVVASTGNVTGTAATGITATTTGGNGTVNVTTSNQAFATNTVSGATFGILASSTGTGSTTVTTNALTVATAPGTLAVPSAVNGGTGPVGISATGGTGGGVIGATTGVTVNANNNVTAAGGRAIVTNSANNGVINIANGVTVSGLGDETGVGGATATHAVIDVTTASGATTTVNNAGTVTSGNAAPASYGDLALLGAGGNVTLNNSGLLLGRVNTSALTGANKTAIANSGTWHTTGTSTLSAGNDTLTNSGLLLTASGGVTTTINFGAGTDAVTNSGTVVVGEAAIAASTLNLTNLETFGNTGVIILGSANNSTSDNQINDRLITGATFTGSAGSLLRLDANLWSDTQTDCNSLTAADCLQIGASAGSTSILVNDTNAHALGAYNPVGIAIVKGSSAASTFSLNSGSEWFNVGGTNLFGGATNVLDKPGMFFYDLVFDGATNRELLVGVPKATAFEMAALGGVGNDVWYTTTQSWFDRQADLRDTVSGRAAGGAPGVWLKVVGDWTRRSNTDSLTLFNHTYTFNTGYNQDTAAIVGGIDFLNVTQADKAWVLGVQGGYVDANVRFKASPDRANLTGTTLGFYGTYVSGGLFVDGIINANFLSLDVSLPGLQTTPNPWTASGDVRTWGGQIEAGYSMPIGASAFWEPVGSLAYGRTTLDDLNIPGGVQQFGDADTFRGSLGARIGTTAAYQYYKVKLALEGRVWDEFDGKAHTALVVPGGPNFLNDNNLDGVFGEVKGEANLFAVGNNLSAFLNGGIKWKSRYQSTSVTLGVRYQW